MAADAETGKSSLPERRSQPSRAVPALAWVSGGCEEKLRARRPGDPAGGPTRALVEPFPLAAQQPAAARSFAEENDFRLPLQARLRDVQKRLFHPAPRTAGGWLLMDIGR